MLHCSCKFSKTKLFLILLQLCIMLNCKLIFQSQLVSPKCAITVYFFLFFFTKVGLLSKLKLATGGICFLWCGGWAYSGMGAFAFSCALSLHCVFCTVAQLLGLVFPSLPVFASGGWGVSVGLLLLQGGPCRWTWSPTTCKQTVECVFWWSLWKVWVFCAGEWAYFNFWPD